MPALVLTRTGLGLTDYAVRLIVIGLTVLLILIQYPLWLGKGSWLRVWEIERQLVHQNKANERLVERNRALEGEVRDLKQGTGAIEERARYELGLMRPDEVFVQVSDPGAAPPVPAPASGTPPAPGMLRTATIGAPGICLGRWRATVRESTS